MKYTIDAELMPIFAKYRLNEDGKWRPLEDIEIIKGDLVLTDPSEVKKYYSAKGEIKAKGNTYEINPDISQLGSDEAFISPRLHRTKKPRTFTEEELRNVLVMGDDEECNVLVLKVNGMFELKQPPFNETTDPSKDPEVVMRYEAFVAGNSYVGENASYDKEFVKDTYLTMLSGWVEHLKTGELNLESVDFEEYVDEEELNEELEKIMKEF